LAKNLISPTTRQQPVDSRAKREQAKQPTGKDVLLLLKEVRETLPDGSAAAIKLDRVLGEVRLALPYDPDNPADMSRPLRTLTELLDEVPESAKYSLFLSIVAIDETERLCKERLSNR
jgi:hypothetical protein